MTTTKSDDYWIGYDDETNYAGGVAGAAYAETEPANTAALTSWNYPMNEEQDVPAIEYIHEAKEAAGQAMTTKQTFIVDETILPGKSVHFVQNATWIDKAIAGTMGAVPTDSWCQVYKDGQRLRYAYGCYTTTYTLELSKTTDPKETVEYGCYEVKTGTDGNFGTAKAWDTTAEKKHSDFTVTIDGVPLNDYDTLKITITKTYTEKQAGQLLHKYPYLVGINIEIEIGTFDYDSDHFLDLESSTADLFTITVTGFGAKTLSATNMKVKNGTLNINKVPAKGLKTYSCTFEIGGACVLSTA